jgi:hypothetical protein
LDSHVEFPGGAATRLYQTIDMETSPATGDKRGQVTKGSLTIRGLLFSAKIRLEDCSNAAWLILKDQRHVLLRRGPFNHSLDTFSLYLDIKDESFMEDNTISCLRVARLRHSRNEHSGSRESEYMLLLRSINCSNKYERIGIISQRKWSRPESMAAFWASDENPFAQGGEERTVEII